jgi:alkanesulfonate monooxygenase SsuD/methylene tetrahydromethanopterin reductase-like flavin-dependent oxidoreductase (luciferase family)
LEEEFTLLGAPFRDRGRRADRALRDLRRVLGRREVDGFVIDPCAAQERVPIWVGGRTERSLRRAVELGDGWCPFQVSPADAAAWLRAAAPPPGFDVVLFPEPPVDPAGDAAGTVATIAPYVDAGATILNLRFRNRSLAECLDQLDAMTTLELT